jgi:hypothetical protein
MRKEIADLWCEALRSGEFPQGMGYLDKSGKVCILGVLVNLAMCMGVCDFTPVKDKGAFDNELGRVPVSVKEWAEMYGQNGEIRGEFLNLTWYNDFGGYDFTELADIIEENYERI